MHPFSLTSAYLIMRGNRPESYRSRTPITNWVRECSKAGQTNNNDIKNCLHRKVENKRTVDEESVLVELGLDPLAEAGLGLGVFAGSGCRRCLVAVRGTWRLAYRGVIFSVDTFFIQVAWLSRIVNGLFKGIHTPTG